MLWLCVSVGFALAWSRMPIFVVALQQRRQILRACEWIRSSGGKRWQIARMLRRGPSYERPFLTAFAIFCDSGNCDNLANNLARNFGRRAKFRAKILATFSQLPELQKKRKPLGRTPLGRASRRKSLIGEYELYVWFPQWVHDALLCPHGCVAPAAMGRGTKSGKSGSSGDECTATRPPGCDVSVPLGVRSFDAAPRTTTGPTYTGPPMS
jgi:hypothetical protein